MLRHSISLARAARHSLPQLLRRNYTVSQSSAVFHNFDSPILALSEEVQDAIQNNRPVVALESTIYTHGFPYPDSLTLAQDLEAIVRKHGAIPATIGIIGGMAKIGLSPQDLGIITQASLDPDTMKISRKDLPYILGMGIAGRKIHGGTTVSATMMLARRAGIKVFGTGGLGGVHRGGENSMDVSADLTELGRTNIAVISSGCKSFLDIPRTLEYLETQGAGVYTFADGRTGDIEFPAFYTRDSGVKSNRVVQNATEAAAIIYAQTIFNGHPNFPDLKSGLLFANPIPDEFSIPKSKINFAIDQAVQEAAVQGFHGAANTPFILSRIKELTAGNSLPANRALIESNVRMAAMVACEYSKLASRTIMKERKENFPTSRQSTTVTKATVSSGKTTGDDRITMETDNFDAPFSEAKVLVLGSVALDISCDVNTQSSPSSTAGGELQLHTSNPSKIVSSIGGVGYNVARAVRLIGGPESVNLCSIVADDSAGQQILSRIVETFGSNKGIALAPASSRQTTAQYVAVNDMTKSLVVAMADMDIFHSQNAESMLSSMKIPENLKWVVVDGNWGSNLRRNIMAEYSKAGVKVAYEPVSVAKSAQTFLPNDPGMPAIPVYPQHIVNLATPNQHELAAMHRAARANGHLDSEEWWKVIDTLGISSAGARSRFVSITNPALTDQGVPLQSVQLLPFFPTIITKLGADGLLLTQLMEKEDPRLRDSNHAPYILSRSFPDSESEIQIGGVYMRLYPSVEKVDNIVSVNGVGDTLLGVLVAGLARGVPLDQKLINLAQEAAVMTLRSNESVGEDVSQLSEKLNTLVYATVPKSSN